MHKTRTEMKTNVETCGASVCGMEPAKNGANADSVKPKRGYRLSEKARARMGRKPTYPEIGIVARREGVSLGHVYRVLKGERISPYIAQKLNEVRAELAAQAAGGNAA